MADTTTATYALTKPEVNVSTNWPTLLNGDLDSLDTELGKPRYPFNSPAVAGTTTCDLSLARVFVFTVSQATTLAFSNVPSASFAVRIRLLITNGSAFVLTWPAAISWIGGLPPNLKLSGVDEVELLTKDAGTTWYATLRNNPGPTVLYQNQGLTTTNTSDASLASYSVPASTLAVNGQKLRITIRGTTAVAAGLPNIKFGATVVHTVSIPTTLDWNVVIEIVRTGAATQISHSHHTESANNTRQAPVTYQNRATPAETLSGAITLDFRGSVTAGGTLAYDMITVERLAA